MLTNWPMGQVRHLPVMIRTMVLTHSIASSTPRESLWNQLNPKTDMQKSYPRFLWGPCWPQDSFEKKNATWTPRQFWKKYQHPKMLQPFEVVRHLHGPRISILGHSNFYLCFALTWLIGFGPFFEIKKKISAVFVGISSISAEKPLKKVPGIVNMA